MTINGYGRYKDEPEHVGCPRAATDMTPCVARDGRLAVADDKRCVGCRRSPASLLQKLAEEYPPAHDVSLHRPTDPRLADALASHVRAATEPEPSR